MYFETRQPDELSLIADTRFIRADEFEGILRLVDRLLIEGAQRDFDPRGLLSESSVERLSPGRSWARIDGCWTDLDATRRMLAEVTGLSTVRVEVTGRNTSDARIVAYVVGQDCRLSPGELPTAYFQALPRWRNAMVPHQFVLNATGPQ
jgi:hypothetical protein